MTPADMKPHELIAFMQGQLDILNLLFYNNQTNLVLSPEITEPLGETFIDMNTHLERIKEVMK